MPVMSKVEQVVCLSAPWCSFTERVVTPWALDRRVLSGDLLELGSGAGAMAAELLRRFPDVTVTATDVDPAMLAAARVRLDPYGQRARIAFADATALPFADGRFDVVVAFIMLHHVIAWETMLFEAVRVLRPGGVLVGYDLLRSLPSRVLHRLDGSPHRLATADALRRQLGSLDVGPPTVNAALGGLVARFDAVKRALPPKRC